MALYSGSVLDQHAPWPTRRIHAGILGPEGRAGWEALLEAERDFRERVLAAQVAGTR